MSMDFNGTTPYDTLVEKWNPLLDHEAIPSISDSEAVILSMLIFLRVKMIVIRFNIPTLFSVNTEIL